jgi:uncharacterized protein (TIGR02246 family)
MPLVLSQLRDFAARYTAAWCSHDPSAVASFFSPAGSLTINDGAPSVGHVAIAQAAQAFMTDFPDLQVLMDDLRLVNSRVEYHWTLLGTNTGPGGTGRKIRISGFESWLFSPENLIAESVGTFDVTDYHRQLHPS